MSNRRHGNQRRQHRGFPEPPYYDVDEPEEATPVPWRSIATFVGALTLLLLYMRSDTPALHTMDNMPDPHADKTGLLGSLLAGVTGKTEPPFITSKFKYGFPVSPNEHTLPPPISTNQTTVVLVLSARDHFARRAAIRDTWAKTNDNVYFVVGGPDPGDKADTDKSKPSSVLSLLLYEQELHGDLIDSIHPESYKALPYKLHYGMKWVIENVHHVNWIAKADDDHVVRVKLLEYFVLRKFNPHHPSVIGGIVVGAPPHRNGKWAEDPKFKASVYPPWAFGSGGYVVSRAVAEYVATEDSLYYYQGEDAGLGIWLDESPLQVTWIDTPEMNRMKACEDKYYMIGHDLTVDEIKACWNLLGDNVPERKSIVAFGAGRKDQHPTKISGW